LRIWTIRKILDKLVLKFEKNKITSPKLNAELIISHVLKIKKLELYFQMEKEISESQFNIISAMSSRRLKNEPLQYILGETEFYGFRIKVSKDVLIPRPETELLVEKIIHDEKNINSILDIGTGSGAIAIALAKNLNNVIIEATDISNDALLIAKQNAAFNCVDINFRQSDIFSDVPGTYDLIISNPPYISQKDYDQLPIEIKDFEPKSALQADDNGLIFYNKILQNAKEHLTESGKIYFEIGYDQAIRITEIAKENGFKDIQVYQDLNNLDRIMSII